MPEIKRNFTGGKMNKDLDERLIPNGQYKHAENIKVLTTDDDDAGTVQNLLGNASAGSMHNTKGVDGSYTKVIGSVADEKNDNIYFLCCAPSPNNIGIKTSTFGAPVKYIDYIAEYNANSGEVLPIAVDHFATTAAATDYFNLESGFMPNENGWVILPLSTAGAAATRVGMFIEGFDNEGELLFQGNIINVFPPSDLVSDTIIELDTNNLNFDIFAAADGGNVAVQGLFSVRLTTDKFLEFDYDSIITGINVIDDVLCFTDNIHEPKKINIKKFKAGSNISTDLATNFSTHTTLMAVNPSDLAGDFIQASILDPVYNNDGFVKKEHVTVIKKYPKTPLTLEMNEIPGRSGAQAEVNILLSNQDGEADGGYSFILETLDEESSTLSPGDIKIIQNPDFENTFYFADDVLNIASLDSNTELTASFLSYVDESGNDSLSPTDTIKISMITTDPDNLQAVQRSWSFSLRQRQPIFELKLARFSYRYRYDDGEYSAFAPFSELAFLPGNYNYSVDEAHNLGMKNNTRELILKDFIPVAGHRPIDVSEIDILYKETNTANVYTIKTIKRGIDDEWEDFTPQTAADTFEQVQDDLKQGQLTVTSEMIHLTLASNQILRGFDNVPKKALAQETVGGRLVYGNYTQGFNIPEKISLKQNIISEPVGDSLRGQKSVKSLRHYKWGIVFGDEFGRETPVITSGLTVGTGDNISPTTGDIYVDKEKSPNKNSFELNTILAGDPQEDFDYIKYYVKETSNEYYNLIMDRWYLADDDDMNENRNLWLSFPSADRNKVDEETYLILKKKHGTNDPVNLEEGKYKIIAIENNAPEFIKTDHRIIGSRHVEPGNSQTGKSVFPSLTSNPEDISPISLIGSNAVDMHPGLTKGLFDFTYMDAYNGDDQIYERVEIKGKLKARIIGVIAYQDYQNSALLNDNTILGATGTDASFEGTRLYTEWNEVIRRGPVASNVIRLFFRKNWSDEVDMRTRFLNMGIGNPNSNPPSVPGLHYRIEFKEELVENKPEFDGRFFVKIQQDSLLINNVLPLTEVENYFPPISTSKMSYIASVNQNQGQDANGSYNGEIVGDGSDLWFYGNFESYSDDDLTASDYSSSGNGYGVQNFTPWKDPAPYVDVDSIIDGDNDNPYNANAPSADYQVYNDDDSIGPFNPDGVAEGFATVFKRYNTREFWKDYNNTFGTNNQSVYFIDCARAWKLTIGGENFNFRRPTGLDAGEVDFTTGIMNSTTPTSGHLGRLCLATTAKNDSELNSVGAEFKQHMSTINNLFSFADDPSGSIYKILKVEFYEGGRHNYGSIPAFDEGESGGPYGPNLTSLITGDATGDFNYKKRVGFRINFRKVNNLNQETNDAINPAEFDPRSHMRHDGSKTIDIILRRFMQTGNEPSVFTTDGACWETEPKEDIGLDLYYEASKAIPLKLKENNVFDYIPIGSEFSISRQEQEQEVDIDLSSNGQYSNFKVDKVVTRPIINNSYVDDGTNCPIIRLVSTDASTEEAVGHDRDILPGDFIKFKHRDGTVTQSRVIDVFEKVGLPIINANIANLAGLDVSEIYPSWQPTDPLASAGIILDFKITYRPAYTAAASIYGNQVFTQFGAIESVSALSFDTQQLLTQGIILQAEDTSLGFPTSSLLIDAIPGYGQSGIVTSAYFQQVEWFIDNIISGSVESEDAVFPEVNVQMFTRSEWYVIDPVVHKFPVRLPWFNCYSFGNGLESDRIRDDFNAPQIDNGVKVSSTAERYNEENIKNGLIYSGIYNSTTNLNELNQFITAEKITKNINPSYGSIQALKARYDALIVFAEDKVLKILSNKDVLFNADGNTQLLSTNKVLGVATPYVGEYGISQNPESLASDQYRIYFTDKQRGAVLRLSRDGLTPISDAGMRAWFRENLRSDLNYALGTYDIVNGEYNLTLNYVDDSLTNYTVTYNEASKGWVSFKSYLPRTGQSVSGRYITAINAVAPAGTGDTQTNNLTTLMIWKHYDTTVNRNNFYGTAYESRIDVVLNDSPELIKSFRNISYEGSKAKVEQFATVNQGGVDYQDGEFYNLTADTGWHVQTITTDKDSGQVPEFIEKEGKWFNKISGSTYTAANTTDLNNTNDFEVQGLGVPSVVGSVIT